MPFYLRKSVSAGPFRFNFSRGGVGVSVGVRGLRIGTGPRGHYVHAGAAGLYYRASLGRAGESHRRPTPLPDQHPAPVQDSSIQMVEIESDDVLGMTPEMHRDLLKELNDKQNQTRLSVVIFWSFAALGFLALLADPRATLAIWGVGVVGTAIGQWLDSYRRATVVFYELEAGAEVAYQTLTQAFDQMAASGDKWHVEAGGAVQDLTTWKRNAGAAYVVRRKATALVYALPAIIKSNVTPPSMAVGRQTLFFLPDVILILDGKKIGAVGYAELNLRYENSPFIEEERVPHDATVIRHTWKHPNKNGGPDRRFTNNYQIPVCLYETMHLTSASGLNELVEFSRTGVAAPFRDAVAGVAANTRPADAPAALLPPGAELA